MITKVNGKGKEVLIGGKKTVTIGERINPTGKKKIEAALKAKNYEVILEEAKTQIKDGADILDVNVGVGGVNEVEVLPELIEYLQKEIDVPLCIDSGDPKALEAALKVYEGKALVNSVNGEESSINSVLPLIKKYNCAVIALLKDEKGIPSTVEGRLEVAKYLFNKIDEAQISREDIVVDCLALSVAVESEAALITLDTIKQVHDKYDVNITLGASNVSFSLPARETVNNSFLPLGIYLGLTCPVVDVAKVRKSIVATDMILGRDRLGLNYIKCYRKNKSLFE